LSIKPEVRLRLHIGKSVNNMKNRHLTAFGVAILMLVTFSFDAQGENNRQLSIESLLGKFDGMIQVENLKPVGHAYQTEIVAVDRLANTVTLTASCMDCGTKRWTRNSCEIKEANELIRFTCKGPKNDEEYTFDGKSLKATGFGNKYPYSINVTKLTELPTGLPISALK
jgi:hypothetical protein